MGKGSVWMARIALIGVVGIVGLLGVGWAIDRAHRWETPRLDPPLFASLRPEPPGRARGTWVMPINLRCPSCMARAREFGAAGRVDGPAFRRVFLVVDQPRSPSALALADLNADAVWWDRRGVWRHRWGHRLYGEVLRFDAAGRYCGTTPPSGSRGESKLASEKEGG